MAPAKVAFSPVAGHITPRQFGPIKRTPARLLQNLPLQLGAGGAGLAHQEFLRLIANRRRYKPF
jgi:hypothetical protein